MKNRIITSVLKLTPYLRFSRPTNESILERQKRELTAEYKHLCSLQTRYPVHMERIKEIESNMPYLRSQITPEQHEVFNTAMPDGSRGRTERKNEIVLKFQDLPSVRRLV